MTTTPRPHNDERHSHPLLSRLLADVVTVDGAPALPRRKFTSWRRRVARACRIDPRVLEFLLVTGKKSFVAGAPLLAAQLLAMVLQSKRTELIVAASRLGLPPEQLERARQLIADDVPKQLRLPRPGARGLVVRVRAQSRRIG